MAGMAWYRDRDVECAQPPPDVYLAPSWSWASIMCGVEFVPVTHPLAELVDCRVEPLRATAPFGRVAGGEVTIRAKTLRAAEVAGRVDPSAVYYDHEVGDRESHVWALLGQAKLLGQTKEMGSCDHVALVLQPSRGGTHRRRGVVFYGDQSLWEQSSEQIIRIE